MKILDLDIFDKQMYTGRYKAVPFEIINWNFRSAPEGAPKKNWNYYLYLFEASCVDFKELWLKPKKVRFSEESPWRNQFCFDIFANVEMHGGITYYAKLGEGVERCVKIGCDFMHLYDDAECDRNVTDIVVDVKEAIDSLYKYGYLKPLAAE